MKRCSPLSAIKKMQIKIKMSYPLHTHQDGCIFLKTTIVGQERVESLHTAGTAILKMFVSSSKN